MLRPDFPSVSSIVVLFALTYSGVHGQTTLFVDDDTCPATGIGTQVDPLCRIQRAVELSVPGDKIVVAPGTYVELVDFIGKGVTIQSSDGAAVTVIDAGDALEDPPGTGKPVVRCDSGEGPDSILEGFTLTGGTGRATEFGDSLGGGMFIFNSSPTITNCVFSRNAATDGGGMFISGGTSKIVQCRFLENTATRNGGGIESRSRSDASLTDCVFSGNRAINGGGMRSNGSNLALIRCTFSTNTATGRGGGIYSGLTNPTITDCVLSDNTSNFAGGGVYNTSSNPIVTNTLFVGNTSSDCFSGGGGMYNTDSSPTVANCIFSGNSTGIPACPADGGGMLNVDNSNPTVTSCTFSANFAANRGGGIANLSGTTRLVNCILWLNSAGTSSPQLYNDAVSTTDDAITIVRSSNIDGSGGSSFWRGESFGTDDSGNIDANPLFVDADGDDDMVGTLDDNLRLSPGSPSIDAGFSFAAPKDLDGNIRIVDDPATPDTGVGFPAVIDMGAYEFGSTPFKSADLDLDGDVDNFDFALMQAAFTGPTVP